jgi:hypothetical protein
MAKKAKKIKTNKGLKLEIVNPNAAGIDVSSTEMQVCVPEDRDSKEVQHMQKYMELMNIKLCNVISDILGKSGQDIISAINGGERNAKVLASLADSRCKTSREEIEKSLEANWDENLLFMLKQSFDLYHYIQKQMVETEKKVEIIILKYKASLPPETVHTSECKRSGKPESPKNKISIDISSILTKIFPIGQTLFPTTKYQEENFFQAKYPNVKTR